MARLISTPAAYLKKHLTGRSRVLLINPPVQERRYHWIRWNQPMDVLRLSSWLKATHRGIDVKLIDFMSPDENGNVPKHKVKDTWTGAETDSQLWHFGQPFEALERRLSALANEGWRPTVVDITSLTSYWHKSIEKLLHRLCTHLTKERRSATLICLGGNYPTFEPEHAEGQFDADVAFTSGFDTSGHCPDFALYLDGSSSLPPFFALDIEARDVKEHLAYCLSLKAGVQRRVGNTRPPAITVAFFNQDVCSAAARLSEVAEFAQEHPRQLVVEGICGVEPASLTYDRLTLMKLAAFKTLFVEHARLPGGGIDVSRYQALLSYLDEETHRKKSGQSTNAWLERGNVTGFVAMGLPDDDIDQLVRSTLTVNRFFQAVILKPHGYSPTVERASVTTRRSRWPQPYASSPQWFPYVGHGSRLSEADYENLVRWQNVLNKRVKGSTFDFLDSGVVASLVRETLVAESWKRHAEAR